MPADQRAEVSPVWLRGCGPETRMCGRSGSRWWIERPAARSAVADSKTLLTPTGWSRSRTAWPPNIRTRDSPPKRRRRWSSSRSAADGCACPRSHVRAGEQFRQGPDEVRLSGPRQVVDPKTAWCGDGRSCRGTSHDGQGSRTAVRLRLLGQPQTRAGARPAHARAVHPERRRELRLGPEHAGAHHERRVGLARSVWRTQARTGAQAGGLSDPGVAPRDVDDGRDACARFPRVARRCRPAAERRVQDARQRADARHAARGSDAARRQPRGAPSRSGGAAPEDAGAGAGQFRLARVRFQPRARRARSRRRHSCSSVTLPSGSPPNGQRRACRWPCCFRPRSSPTSCGRSSSRSASSRSASCRASRRSRRSISSATRTRIRSCS